MRAFISIGSNIDPERYLQLALLRIKALGQLQAISEVYESPACLPDGHPSEGAMENFLNVAALLQTDQEPLELKQSLRSIEKDLGRMRSDDKYAARTIDLDLSMLGTLLLDDPELVLPDPEILERAHLAVPLAQLDPSFEHPITKEKLELIAQRLRPSAALTERSAMTMKLRHLVMHP
jgi:2-amino-4-hydroxy-6-hydroxymethyldihydropteridine diphosphokinase